MLRDHSPASTAADPGLDRIARLAAELFDAPAAVVVIARPDGSTCGAAMGLDAEDARATAGLLATISAPDSPVVVGDARRDRRTRAHPLVSGRPGVRFLVSATIGASDGTTVGALAVLDQKSRPAPPPSQLDRFADLAALAADQLEVRHAIDERHALQVLLSEQERYKLVADNVADVIALLSLDGVILYASPSLMRLKGVDPRNVVGLDAIDQVLESERPAYRNALAALAAGAEETAIQHRIINAAGDLAWMETRFRVVRDGAGSPIRIVAASRDITERRALQETLERARDLAEQQAQRADSAEALAGLGHWRVEADTHEVIGSDQLFRIYGLQPCGPVTPDQILDLVHPDELEANQRLFDRLRAGSQREHLISRIVRRDDGAVRYVEIFARAERDASGRVTAFVGTVLDIHERRQAEMALADSEARYRMLADSANDLIIHCNRDTRLTYVSPSVRNILGYEAEELIGRPMPSLLHDEDRDRVHAQIVAQAAANDSHACGVEYRLVAKDGRSVWVEGNPHLEVDPFTGEFRGASDLLRDVTARKALEQELHTARIEAEAAAAAKSEFLANMSHELRTPLTSIVGFTGLVLEQPGLPRAARGHMERVADASQALLCAVNDILDFSKLEAGQISIEPRPVSLSELCGSTLALFSPQAAAKHLDLICEGVDEAHDVLISLDPDRMRQVLLNLVGNAVKFTPQGRVTLRADYDVEAQTLGIEVIDTGPGVPAEKLDLLFKRFSQVDGSLSRAHGGTGLGLAICKGVVEAMGGEIGVDSQEGHGSRFWLRAPAPLAEAPGSNESAAEDGGLEALSGLRVLVTDDHPANRELARLFLESVGVEVTEARDGEEAVGLAGEQPFDAVVMDVRMPRLNGPDALRRIRSGGGPNARTPILAFTADAGAEDAARLAGEGFCGVVTKPVDPATLLSAVRQAVAEAGQTLRMLASA